MGKRCISPLVTHTGPAACLVAACAFDVGGSGPMPRFQVSRASRRPGWCNYRRVQPRLPLPPDHAVAGHHVLDPGAPKLHAGHAVDRAVLDD